MMESASEFVEHIINLGSDADMAEKLCVARDAAIRKECADRAMHWLEELHGVEPDPALPWSKKLMRIRELQRTTLRAAIMGE